MFNIKEKDHLVAADFLKELVGKFLAFTRVL